MANPSRSIIGIGVPWTTDDPGHFSMIVKEVDVERLDEQMRDTRPIPTDKLGVILSTAQSMADWAVRTLSASTKEMVRADAGYIFRTTPLIRFPRNPGQPANPDGRTQVPRPLPRGNWMVYSAARSTQPLISTLMTEGYNTIPERYLIRREHGTDHYYACIPSCPWAPWLSPYPSPNNPDNVNGNVNSNNNASVNGSINGNSIAITPTPHCDHCFTLGLRPNLTGFQYALAPRALCHFHLYFMTTGKILTRWEQLVLDRLDREGSVIANWGPQETALFVRFLKARIGQLRLRENSQPLGSMTATESRVARIDNGVVGEGRHSTNAGGAAVGGGVRLSPVNGDDNENNDANDANGGDDDLGIVTGAAFSPDDDVFI